MAVRAEPVEAKPFAITGTRVVERPSRSNLNLMLDDSAEYTLLEQLCLGRRLDPAMCEDRIFTGRSLVAVLDGATAKSDLQWGALSSGLHAVQHVFAELAKVPVAAEAREAVDQLTRALYRTYVECGRAELVARESQHRPTVSFVAISTARRELWIVGDCQALVNGRLVTGAKLIDKVNAEARALYLEGEILAGKSVAELLLDDVGRRFVWPLVTRQTMFQNKPEAGEFWFAAIDGFPVPAEGIHVERLPDEETEVVLATDGYPMLKPTLAESEAAVQRLIVEDPLCFRTHTSVKGIAPGDRSFDDRAYVRIRLSANQPRP